MRFFRQLLLAITLLTLVSCGSGRPVQSVSVVTPGSTQTLGITPTPTVPTVLSRSVRFLTSDHVQLAGLLYGRGKTVVICSHMARTDKSIWSDSGIAQRLAQHGYLVLTYDFRGNGDSSGSHSIWMLDVDLRAAILFAREQGATRVVLLGASMGGTATLQVASDTSVAAVITLSAPQDFGNGVSDAQVKAIRAPKLFINSQDDSYASQTSHMYDVASSPKDIYLYKGAAHGTDIFADPGDGSDLTRRILTFVAHYAFA